MPLRLKGFLVKADICFLTDNLTSLLSFAKVYTLCHTDCESRSNLQFTGYS